ncbi:MAG: hypothetical protein P8Y05_00675 [Deinococcales bacterium]
MSGLPSGVNGVVQVTMGSYAQTVSASATLSGLAPGTYTIAPQTLSLRRNAFNGSASSSTVTVSAGNTASVSVSYAAQRGDLWVPDYSANTLDMFAAGSLESSPAPSATINGGLNGPTGVAFDASGNLWVGNQGVDAVVRYAAASLTSSPSPAAPITTGASKPAGVALDVNGNLWVTHQGTASAVEEFAAADIAAKGSYTPTATATIGGFNNAEQAVFDPPPYNLRLSR